MRKEYSYTNLSRMVLTVFTFSLISLSLQAQVNFQEMEFDSSETYRVELNDGSVFIGKFLEKDGQQLVISTNSLPRVEIPFSNIRKVEIVDRENIKDDGSYWFPNPNPTRYFFSPSAFNLKKGEGYYQNSYLVINSINVGVTDFFSFGGGFELISTFSPDVTPFFFLTPKLGTQISDNVHLSGGLLIANADEYLLGTTYGLVTLGDHDDNVTGGLGWGFFDGEFASNPVITLSGMTRLKQKFSLVSENWFFPDGDGGYYPIFSYGMRFFGEKIAVDLGFLNNQDIIEGIVIGVPYVDFVVKF
jgi:hypothetical protein